MMPDLDDLMDFAVRTADAAGSVTLEHFGSVAVEFKADGSEITEADRASEACIRDRISERFPDHGVFGEEGTAIEPQGRYRWIVDPIDGTRSFASGVPVYGILIALEVDGAVLLGCAHFPALRETVVAARGAGCWHNGRSARVSDCDDPAAARVVTSGFEYWRDWGTPASRAGFESLLAPARFGRTWGDSFGYLLIATGRADVFADPACGEYWDIAPMAPLIEEAGGRITRLGGGRVGPWSSVLASNGKLHDRAAAHWAHLDGEDAVQSDEVRRRRGA